MIISFHRPQLQRDTAQLAKITNSSVQKVTVRIGELDEVSDMISVFVSFEYKR